MSEEQRKILDMLAAGKVSVDDAEKLLSAISSGETGDGEGQTGSPQMEKSRLKYLRVVVEPDDENGKGDRINIRIPLKLIRTGLKWVSFIPEDTRTKVNEALRDKGIEMDFSKMTPDDLEELIENLDDLTVDVEGQEKVRIFCE